MPRLIKRSSVTPPKPLPQRDSEEDTGTSLVIVEETPKEPFVPSLGWCINCKNHAAHSWVRKLCYRCQKLEDGFDFDEDKKLWIKPERKKK